MLLGTSGKSAGLASRTEFDVVVIGGGPAGAATAITVARAGGRVLLLDQNDGKRVKTGESLPAAANPLLGNLGISQETLAGDHILSSGIQSSWGSQRLGTTHFIQDPRGHGWHLERLAFDAMLLREASACGVEIKRNAKVTRVNRDSRKGWTIGYCTHAASLTVTTEWVADCSGRQSRFARQQGARRIHDDRLIAFAAFLKQSRPGSHASLNRVTLIESVEHGWWYCSPVPGEGFVLVYLTDADGQHVHRARTMDGFLSLWHATHHIAQRVPPGSADDIVLVANQANSSRLDHCWGPGWVAGGDASVSFDPLSSQGIFNALYSGIKAGEALLRGIRGDLSLFPSYETRLQTIYSIYLSRRNHCYSLERRWQNSPFWLRRARECAA